MNRACGRYAEARQLCLAGPDVFGRDAFLDPGALTAWRAMVRAAEEDGIRLLLLSGIRSVAQQAEILSWKLEGGAELAEILRVNAYPSFSEHHTGRAINVGSPSCTHLDEVFKQTLEYT